MPNHSPVKTLPILCGACGLPATEEIGAIPFYLPDRDILTTLWRCIDCGTYTRDIDLDDPEKRSHFDVASYTDQGTEEKFRAVRSGYFAYLARLLEAHLRSPLKGVRVLDVGTAYGHFLQRLIEEGALPEGVEIVAALRKSAAGRGLLVHDSIPDSSTRTFDAITVIDSLYYTNDPLATLQRLLSLLSPDGCLLVRVANRTWLLDLLRAAGIVIHRDHFGDAKFNFSPEGTLRLLERANFRVEDVVWDEKGKADPRWLIRLYYRIGPLLGKHLSLRVAPGMLVVARAPK